MNIFQKFLQKWTPHTLLTLFWYPTTHIWNFHFVCKKIFLIKANKIFCIWCPKSVMRGVKLYFKQIFRCGFPDNFLSTRHSRTVTLLFFLLFSPSVILSDICLYNCQFAWMLAFLFPHSSIASRSHGQFVLVCLFISRYVICWEYTYVHVMCN